MRNVAAVACLSVVLSACTVGVESNTLAVGTSLADIQREQIMLNLARFRRDRNAIPSQFEIGNLTASSTNALTTGVAPNVALRAIAITGFNLSNLHTANQGYGISAIQDITDLRLLQVLYRYATRQAGLPDTPQNPASFEGLADLLAALSRGQPTATGVAVGTTKIRILRTVIGDLPPAPLLLPDGECPLDTALRLGRRVCFSPDDDTESRFILWASALTQDIRGEGDAPAVPAQPPAGREVRPAPPPAQVQGLRIQRRPETLVQPVPSQIISPR